MATFLIATRNAHKVGEIQSILGSTIQFLTLRDFPGAPEVVEDASTFAGNAAKKAVQLAHWLCDSKADAKYSQLFVLADDSGLEVDALNGAPGVHSARFAVLDSGRPGNSPDAENSAKLLRLMKNVPDGKRTARFRCVIALVKSHLQSSTYKPQLFDGVCEGKIASTPRGQNGFGYDPLFVPDGFEQTFGELGERVKNGLSHRAKALKKLRLMLGTLFTSG